MTATLGILLALCCAVATNIGFLYKHRGACAAPPVDVRHPLRSGKALFQSKLFAIGMLIATGAWIFHIAAMAVAPLSLVQAVLAGGIVLLAIMAERYLGLKIGKRQWIGVSMTAVGLSVSFTRFWSRTLKYADWDSSLRRTSVVASSSGSPVSFLTSASSTVAPPSIVGPRL